MRRAIAHPYLFPALAVLVLLAGGMTAAAATQHSSNQASIDDSNQQNLEFSIVPVHPQGAPSGYFVGSGEVEIELHGTNASVQVDLEHANPNTNYTVVLSVDNKNTTIGTISTHEDGEGELETTVTLPAGSYQVSVHLFDASTFSSPKLVGASSPVLLTVSVATSTISGEDEGDDEQGQNNQTSGEQENDTG